MAQDTEFARAVVEEGYASREEVEACRALQEKLIRMGVASKRLDEILLEKGVISRKQRREIFEILKNGDPLPQIPGYELLEKLGEGGMGVVYKARQTRMDRLVAVKILHRHLCMSPSHVKKFRREAKVLAKMSHKNIVASIEMGEVKKRPYFIMEYLDGTPLNQILAERKYLPEKEVVSIAKQMAEALRHVHARGFVHADIKPHNIVRLENSLVKLMDFGLATPIGKIPDEEKKQAVGTPYYISPEQAKGVEPLDERSDLYSLGATLYHLIVGIPPFDGDSPMVVMAKHLTDEVVPPIRRSRRISPGFNQIILKLLARDPAKRFQKAEELLSALETFITTGKVPFATKEVSAALVTSTEARRRRKSQAAWKYQKNKKVEVISLATMVVLILAVLGFGGYLGYQFLQSQPPKPVTKKEEDAAWSLLREAALYKGQNPDDLPGILRHYEKVFLTYPGTRAAAYARKVYEDLQGGK